MSNQKSNDVVLRVTDKLQWGKQMIITSGTVDIAEDGTFTVDDVTASLLLSAGSGFTLVKGNGTTVDKKKTKKVAPPVEEEEDEDEEEEEEDDDSDEDEDSDDDTDDEEDEDEEEEEEIDLDSLSLKELVAIAEENFEKEDYKKFKGSKKLMIDFLRKNS